MIDDAYRFFERRQVDRGVDLKQVKAALASLEIETPSWGYGDSGTRFKVFRRSGIPRDAFEKFEDAAAVHRMTGVCPSVAIHIPWDAVDDYGELVRHAASLGLRVGAVNPNLFQEDDYMYGSVCNADRTVRRKAIAHMLECVDIARATNSKMLSLWFADGTNYPGQGDIRRRKAWLLEALQEVYGALDGDMRMLIEYKFFEPSFYHTDLADWGMAYVMAQKLGEQADVLVDTGHHAQGTNVEHVVAFLLDEKKLGGFHFNARKYADDDLIVGSANPYELFLIFDQILSARADEDVRVSERAGSVAFMIDQSHCIEPKLPAMIRSVMNVQTQYAKALLVDRKALAHAQEISDVMAAEDIVRTAFEFDVTPLLRVVREEMGVPADPMRAYLESDYPEAILARGKGGASW